MHKISPFAIGDVVQLRSGGPLMTVNRVPEEVNTPDALVSVVWFDEKNALHDGECLPAILTIVKPWGEILR